MSDHTGLVTGNPYERLYRSRGGNPLWGRNPGRLVSGIDQWVTSGTVLDVGCGDGKNFLYLEKRGFQVLGVDMSQTAMAAMHRRAAETGHAVQGRYVIADIEEFSAADAFDAIVSYGLYHCLNPQRRVQVHKRVQDWTVPDGVVLFTCLIEGVPLPVDHFDVPVSLPPEREILDLFAGNYRIEHWETGLITEAHPPLVGPHEHRAVWAVARRIR